MEFTEFELLTIRECLFKCRFDSKIVTEQEFKDIDNSIKKAIMELV